LGYVTYEKKVAWMSDPNEDNPIARFLVSAPLYRKTAIPEKYAAKYDTGVRYISLPETVKRECVSCGAIMSWNSGRKPLYRHVGEHSMHAETYSCRNCGARFSVWIAWAYISGKVIFEKYGQIPKFEVNLPKNLEKSLGEYVAFWRTRMTLRHHGYGLGALVYFRRIVEGMTEALLGC
jgi:hypothetical protein